MILIQKIINRLNPGILLRKLRIFRDSKLFDIINGTDTQEPVYRNEMDLPEHVRDREHMNYYVATLTSRIRKGLKTLLKINPQARSYSFVDLGCGKGKVLLVAAKAGFNKITGVEISEKLTEICISNLQKKNITNVTVVNKNVFDFDLLDDHCVYYIYNSFAGPLLEQLLEKLEDKYNGSEQNVFIIYIEPRDLKSNKLINLNEEKYQLLYVDDKDLNPFHIYKMVN